MLTIAICNQKGGVGKSTTSYHLARAAACKGIKTLVVDADPQGNITHALAARELAEDTLGLADVLSARTNTTLEDARVLTVWDNVSLIPTVGETLALTRDELVVAGAGRERRLREALAGMAESDWGLVLIDCAPALDQLTINALTAADKAVIITHSRLWSANGMAHLLQTISDVAASYNTGLNVAGIIINQFEATTRASRYWRQELETAAASRNLTVYAPPVPKRTLIGDTVESGAALDEQGATGQELAAIYSDYLERIINQ